VWSVRLHLSLNQQEVGDRQDPEGFLGIAGKEVPTLSFTSLTRWMNGPWNFDVVKDMPNRDIHVDFHIIGCTGTCARII
jgi:hypothetical protein